MKNIRLNEPAKIALWIFGAFAFFRLFELLFETPELNFWALAILGIGMYLFIHQPLRHLHVSQAFEFGIAVFCVGIFMIHFGMTVVAPKIESDANDNEPCGIKTREARCYNFSHDACLSAWGHYSKECLDEARGAQLRPTQLVGSGVKKCVHMKLNKYMSFNQKRKDTSTCRDYFDSLKE
jgi:hypothetical protein